ncbi:DUF3369 domain-containing protein [Heliobacterium gestii]|uniref:Stage 0 sporulation protein A homolog n=1 Tax=Heliomicrobium gestii TaxID=2699 RepID=A0A845L8Z8_HELGE|nr:DUF3369 domain-containing protein [Heliomicrobium gestii]MBM7866502.1 response regulator RpfG family c-di-GMP phosphodiesterase [Heliomicrobium gestii]MZP43217.1 DUF3369 domain-containing protein [Heliomicrobium gestii]
MHDSNHPNDDDLLFFVDEHDDAPGQGDSETWKVLIVDDDAEVHKVTRVVLAGMRFDDKPLEFFSAYSAAEAKRWLCDHPDMAVVLLDVVMESDDAGLHLVQHIREGLNNSHVRIVLRTGQPGYAPEERVIVDYDINCYVSKTELTAQKLFSTVYVALRAYRDIRTIDLNRRGLEQIIQSSANIFRMQSMRMFASGVLTQLTSLLRLNRNAIYCQMSGFAATKNERDFYILAATGDYSPMVNRPIRSAVSPSIREDLERAMRAGQSLALGNRYVGYFHSQNGSENLVYLEGFNGWSDWDRNWVELFCSNVGIAFDNISLNEEIESTQREIIFTLGGVVEARSKETGCHVKRVSEYSRLLGKLYGLTREETELLRMASPMHDVGKIAIEDAILNKPGPLTANEYEQMKKHTIAGHEMLQHSNRRILRTAAQIALEHHEKYNGGGYPYGLRGEKIHIYSRITAVADVFDALNNDRVYRAAWPIEDILGLFQQERGHHFDPYLVDLVVKHLDEFLKIQQAFPDH